MSYYRGWEYARAGDYHKNLDPNWSYTPTYYKKMQFVKGILDNLPKDAKILDAGCGEGVLVEEYRNRGHNIEGIDLNYESEYVRRGNILNLKETYGENVFDLVLLLDVFEHLSFGEQPQALAEIHGVLKPNGILIASIPNLAHINSRFNFFFRGVLDRSDTELNHIGERPLKENIRLIKDAGFEIKAIKGITFTMPIVYRRIICRKPSWFRWLHDLLQIFAFPSLSMLNIFVCVKRNIKP